MITDDEVAIEVTSRHTEPLRSKELVAAARSGSAAAFAELREIYAKRVYRKLLIITKNREDAEDALQDTFLRAYKALHAFEERASFYTWITTIAINSALMILRRRRIRSEVPFDRPRETEEAIPDLELKILVQALSTFASNASGMLVCFDPLGSFSLGFVRSLRCGSWIAVHPGKSLRHFKYPKPL